jgi:predicted phosphodiesterase
VNVAVISDIHGERFPLDVVLEDIGRQGIEQIVCLGDAIQGGSQPQDTVSRLRELKCQVVMGNADSWLVTGKVTSKEERLSEKQEEVRKWSLERVSDNDIDFIKSFQSTIEIPLEKEKKLLCFHGSPKSFDDIIVPTTSDDEVRKFFEGLNHLFFAGGHTHTQQVRRIGNSWYINPGSVTLPYNWSLSNFDTGQIVLDPWADYCIINSDQGRLGVTFRHVPYDIEKLANIIRTSGRPYAEEIISMYRKEG